jgi:hypothetical protein
VFDDPAIDYLRGRGITVAFEHALNAMRFAGERVTHLDFADRSLAVGEDEAVILAVPAHAALALVPGLRAPSSYRGIVNVNFRFDPPPGTPPMIGVINGTSEWIFAFPNRIAVTVSDASRLFDMPREQLAQDIWREVATVMKLREAQPPWQIVRERRATFAATPEENAKRPGPETKWCNLFLAGDWTATGLPATIEGAIRSGNRAVDLVVASRRAAA